MARQTRWLAGIAVAIGLIAGDASAADCINDGHGKAVCGYGCVVDGFGDGVCSNVRGATCKVGGDGHAACGFNCIVDGFGATVCANTRDGQGACSSFPLDRRGRPILR
jgi:hypothetical protein